MGVGQSSRFDTHGSRRAAVCSSSPRCAPGSENSAAHRSAALAPPCPRLLKGALQLAAASSAAAPHPTAARASQSTCCCTMQPRLKNLLQQQAVQQPAIASPHCAPGFSKYLLPCWSTPTSTAGSPPAEPGPCSNSVSARLPSISCAEARASRGRHVVGSRDSREAVGEGRSNSVPARLAVNQLRKVHKAAAAAAATAAATLLPQRRSPSPSCRPPTPSA